MLNNIKDKLPLHLHNVYLLVRVLLIGTINTIRHQAGLLVDKLQHCMATQWPVIRQRSLTHANQLHIFLVACADKTKIRLQKYSQRLRATVVRYWPIIKERLALYSQLTRLDRPVGILLLLWPTLWAVWIAAEGRPTLHMLLVFTLGVILTRSAGCVFNDVADRKYDVHVRRTSQRPVAAGVIRPSEALLLATGILLAAFLLVLTTNRFTVLLSFVAVPLAIIYPFMKRHTYIPQFFLGLAFSWGIPMAFAAQTNTIPDIAWLLFMANILWSVVYDTIYAMVDREDDLKVGIKSTAILFDDADTVIIGILQLMFIAVLIIIGIQIKAEIHYYGSLLLAGTLMIYHQYLIRHRDPQGCTAAFLNNHWIGLTIFAGIFLNYL